MLVWNCWYNVLLHVDMAVWDVVRIVLGRSRCHLCRSMPLCGVFYYWTVSCTRVVLISLIPCYSSIMHSIRKRLTDTTILQSWTNAHASKSIVSDRKRDEFTNRNTPFLLGQFLLWHIRNGHVFVLPRIRIDGITYTADSLFENDLWVTGCTKRDLIHRESTDRMSLLENIIIHLDKLPGLTGSSRLQFSLHCRTSHSVSPSSVRVACCTTVMLYNDSPEFFGVILVHTASSVSGIWCLIFPDPPFEGAIQAGVGSMMCSYNLINSRWSCENDETLRVDLKERLNFSGFVMSDWGATHSTSINQGLDQEMPKSSFMGDGILAGTVRLRITTLRDTLCHVSLENMKWRRVASLSDNVLSHNFNNAFSCEINCSFEVNA